MVESNLCGIATNQWSFSQLSALQITSRMANSIPKTLYRSYLGRTFPQIHFFSRPQNLWQGGWCRQIDSVAFIQSKDSPHFTHRPTQLTQQQHCDHKGQGKKFQILSLQKMYISSSDNTGTTPGKLSSRFSVRSGHGWNPQFRVFFISALPSES